MVKAFASYGSVLAASLVIGMAACSSPATTPATPTPSPPRGTVDLLVRGDVADYDTRAPLENVVVQLGDFPSSNRCSGYRCARPEDAQTVLTAADGTFEFHISYGIKFLVIGSDVFPVPNYPIARLQLIVGRDIDVGTVYLTKLAPAERSWFAKFKANRSRSLSCGWRRAT